MNIERYKAAVRDLNRADKLSLLSSLPQGSVAMGRWTITNLAPSRLLDPEELVYLCGNIGLRLPRDFSRAIVTAKEIISLEAVATLYRPLRDALDGLLVGGGTRWREEYSNLVVNEGLDHLLDVGLSGGTQDTSWFVGLLAATPSPLATWTATEIASNDFVNYDEANLQAFTDGGVSSQSVDNSASTADFTCSTNSSSIGGAYLIGTNAKATPAGTLYAAGAFTGGNKAADDGDTLSVTSTFTSAAA